MTDYPTAAEIRRDNLARGFGTEARARARAELDAWYEDAARDPWVAPAASRQHGPSAYDYGAADIEAEAGG